MKASQFIFGKSIFADVVKSLLRHFLVCGIMLNPDFAKYSYAYLLLFPWLQIRTIFWFLSYSFKKKSNCDSGIRFIFSIYKSGSSWISRISINNEFSFEMFSKKSNAVIIF